MEWTLLSNTTSFETLGFIIEQSGQDGKYQMYKVKELQHEGRSSAHMLKRVESHVKGTVASSVFHLFFSLLVVLLVFAHPPDIFSGDVDTARNYLNTIVSSLSTILALCISIILVAIQMSAGNYTHRVLDFYVRLPYNVSLFLFYLATIMHSFFLMAQIRDPINEPLPHPLGLEMSSDLVMVVICFLSLLLYMYAVVQLLKPDRIIELIVREYHRSYERGNYRGALASIEQICDIAKRAASFSDSVTGMNCVSVMAQIAISLPLPESMEDAVVSVHRNIVDQFVEIFGVAVKEQEIGVVEGVLDALSSQGSVYVRGEAWPVAELVVRAYRRLTTNYLLLEGHIFYIDAVVCRIYPLALQASRCGARGQTFAVRTWTVILSIGEAAMTTYPGSMPALLPSLLLYEGTFDTVLQLEDSSLRERALILYFQLWKVLLPPIVLRDVARFGIWWEENAPHDLRALGQELSLTLARHMHREDVVHTLCRIWYNSDQCPMQKEAHSQLLHKYERELFDGWEVPRVDFPLTNGDAGDE